MKSILKKLSVISVALVLAILPHQSFGQKETITKIDFKIVPAQKGEIRLHFKFPLPDFGNVPIEDINIDYAVLRFNVHVHKKAKQFDHNALEVLIADDTGEKILPNLGYNNIPVTPKINRKEKGIKQIEVDITQAVDLWLHDEIPNNGLLLASHRKLAEKILRQGVVVPSANLEPSVIVFYTIFDE